MLSNILAEGCGPAKDTYRNLRMAQRTEDGFGTIRVLTKLHKFNGFHPELQLSQGQMSLLKIRDCYTAAHN
jgi:hypothetical protein